MVPRSEHETSLRKFLAPEIVYGMGALGLVGQYAANLGLTRVFVVSDKGVADAGWVDAVVARLREYGLEARRYLETSENPRDREVMRGAALFREYGADGIVAIGGGSPMDCAKGIGVAYAHEQHINAFEGVDTLREISPPLICIPTTAGSAAEVSQFAIITNTGEERKIALAAKGLVPDVALIDPETNVSMPDRVTSASGVDVLVHAVEAFVSTAHSPMTDLHAIEAAQIAFNTLPEVLSSPGDPVLRSRMLRASMEAGLAFSNAILGAVHAMSHAVGGHYDAVHGVCNGILLPAVVQCNWHAAEERYRLIACALGLELPPESVEARDALVDSLRAFLSRVGNPPSLRAIGIAEPASGVLAGFARADPCMVTNPYQPSHAEVVQLYEQSI